MARIRQKKFDLYVGMGAACSCSQTLRSHYLQDWSYPMDWLYDDDANFMGRVDIVSAKYANYFDKKDLVLYGDEPNGKVAYKNTTSGLVFNHDFMKNKTFDAQYDEIAEKYQRRISRLLVNIEKAKSVLFVYIERPDVKTIATDKEIITACKKLQKTFGNKAHLIYVHHSNLSWENRTDCMLSPNVRKVLFCYQNPKNKDFTVDSSALRKLFREYKISRPLSMQLKRMVLRLIAKIIPCHKWRVAFRKKYLHL